MLFDITTSRGCIILALTLRFNCFVFLGPRFVVAITKDISFLRSLSSATVEKCSNYRPFVSQMIVGVEMYILIGVGGFPRQMLTLVDPS